MLTKTDGYDGRNSTQELRRLDVLEKKAVIYARLDTI